MSEFIIIDEPECELHPKAATAMSMVGLMAGLNELVSKLVDSCIDEFVSKIQNTWARIREIIARILDDFMEAKHIEKEQIKRHRLHALFMAALLFVIAKPIALMFAVCSIIIRCIFLFKHQDRGADSSSDVATIIY